MKIFIYNWEQELVINELSDGLDKLQDDKKWKLWLKEYKIDTITYLIKYLEKYIKGIGEKALPILKMLIFLMGNRNDLEYYELDSRESTESLIDTLNILKNEALGKYKKKNIEKNIAISIIKRYLFYLSDEHWKLYKERTKEQIKNRLNLTLLDYIHTPETRERYEKIYRENIFKKLIKYFETYQEKLLIKMKKLSSNYKDRDEPLNN